MKNRLIAAAAIVIVLVLLGLPFVMGLMTEPRVRAQIAAIDANPALSATLTEYERSWFVSRARIELGLDSAYLAGLDPTAPLGPDGLGAERLPIVVELRHGPVQLGDGLHLGMASVVAHPDPESERVQAWQAQLGMPYLFEFRGRSGFGGGLDFDADVPPIDRAENAASVLFSGLAVEGTASRRRVAANARMDRLEYANAAATTTVEQLEASGDYALTPGHVALGHSEVAVERIAVRSDFLGPGPVFEASGLRIGNDSRLDESGEQLELAVVYSADAVTAGSAFAVSDARLGMTLGHLDADAMGAYYAAMRSGSGAAPAGPDAVLEELETAAQRVLAGEPTLALEPIEFSLDGEAFDGTALLAADVAALPPAGTYDLGDPLLWMQALTLDADATVSKALAERVAALAIRTQLAAAGEDLPPAQLDAIAQGQAGLVLVALAGQGYLTDEGESYSTMLAYRGGALTVNGAPVPLVWP